MTASLATARSALFVPGNRPERFAKAAQSGADAIVLDLEDAVAPEEKSLARRHVTAWLDRGGHGAVRINGSETEWHADDIRDLRGRGATVMLPKAETAEQIHSLLELLGPQSNVVALIETAAGVLNAPAVCAAPGVVRCAFGSVDFSAQLGVDPTTRTALVHARSTLVVASASAQIAAPLDGVTTAIGDLDVLSDDCSHAAGLGFTGKLCIHPRQVEVVNTAFSPSEQQIAWADRVLAACADGNVTVLEGQMIDKPVVERAGRIRRATHFMVD
jgi:citrate lyase subunit beta/citryl-CoA lyase